jgi:hypothetical protein
MSQPLKNYAQLFERLTSTLGGSEVIISNYVKMSIAGAILTERNGEFSLEELDFVSRQMGCELRKKNLKTNANSLVHRGVYIQTENGNYRFNPQYIEPKDIEFLSKEQIPTYDSNKKSAQLLCLPLLHVSSLVTEGRREFDRTSGRFLQIRATAEEQTEPEKALEVLIEELGFSPKAGEYAGGLLKTILKSLLPIPFIKYKNEASEVAKLLHKAGIKLPIGCFNCDSYKKGCEYEPEWDLCYNHKLTKPEIKEHLIKEEKKEIKPDVNTVATEVSKVNREELFETRRKFLETGLEKIRISHNIPPEAHNRALTMLNHLVEREPVYVGGAIDLPALLQYLGSEDVGIEYPDIPLQIEKESARKSFLRATDNLAELLDKTGFPLSKKELKGPLAASVTSSKPPEDLSIQTVSSSPLSPITLPPPETKTLKEVVRDVAIDIKRKLAPHKPIEYKTIREPHVDVPTSTSEKGQRAALGDLYRQSEHYVRYRQNRGSCPQDYEELVKQELAIPHVFAGERTFRITKKGIEKIMKEMDEKLKQKQKEGGSEIEE